MKITLIIFVFIGKIKKIMGGIFLKQIILKFRGYLFFNSSKCFFPTEEYINVNSSAFCGKWIPSKNIVFEKQIVGIQACHNNEVSKEGLITHCC